MKLNLPDKLYYSIGEVAKAFNVNASLIRYWEQEFPIIKPKKNKKGNRYFTPKDYLPFGQRKRIYLRRSPGRTCHQFKNIGNNQHDRQTGVC